MSHKSRLKMADDSFTFKQFMWSTPITIGDLLRYCWIRFLMIFFYSTNNVVIKVLVCFQNLFFFSLFFSFSSLIPSYCNLWRKRGGRERSWKHNEAPMTTLLVSSERLQQKESNIPKKITNDDQSRSHKPSKNDMGGLLAFEKLVRLTPVTADDIS